MLKILTNRSFTNAIHFILDELIPPIIRDKKWFMYIFFYLAYKGKNVRKYMEFKSHYYSLNNDTLEKIYKNYDTIGTDRETDLNKKSLKYILNNINPDCNTLLDVGCGRGYFLKNLQNTNIELTGVDLFETLNILNSHYVKGNAESLPFEDDSFDVVTSSHTLEHVINIREAVAEIKRVSSKQIIITVPKQRWYYYTLDLHLHYFPKKEILINLVGLNNYICKNIRGDWVYIGFI